MTSWLARTGDADGAKAMHTAAESVKTSFDRRFWNPNTGYLYDVIEGPGGDSAECRPNRYLARAGRRSREGNAGDVCARDRQDDGDQYHEHAGEAEHDVAITAGR